MKISIIIIEYFSLNDVEKCINSIRTNLGNNIEIIVSSNSLYNIEKQKEISRQFVDVQWTFNRKNGGFAYAMNQGLAVANGDVLAICNPDCILKKGIGDMANFLIEHPTIGAIGPQMISNNNELQDTCRPYVSLQSYIYRQLQRIIFKKNSVLNRNYDYEKIQTVDWIIGAFIMVSRKAYEQTKGLSEDYFMYAEDLDWCTRIRQTGLEIVYYPKAQIEYVGSRSARKSFKYTKIFIKSHYIYWKKFGFLSGYPKRKKIIYEK